jgi:hypothetical protein
MWIPRQTRSQLPGEESAWLPRHTNLPLKSDNVDVLLPDRVEYQFLPREERDNALDNNIASRIQIHGNHGDMAIAYFEGAADMPQFKPVLDVVPIEISPREIYQIQSPVRLVPIDYRRRSGGIFLSAAVKEWILRFATRYDQPIGDNSNSLPSWSDQTVAGVEKSFEAWGDLVTVIIQGAWAHSGGDRSVLSIQDLYDRAVLLGIRWPIGENWTVLLSGLRSGRDQSTFAQLDVSHRISDEWTIQFIATSLDGPSTSLLGLMSDHDRIALRVTRAF